MLQQVVIASIKAVEQYETQLIDFVQSIDTVSAQYYHPEILKHCFPFFSQYNAIPHLVLLFDTEGKIVALIPLQRVNLGPGGFFRKIKHWGFIDIYAENVFPEILYLKKSEQCEQAVWQYLRNELQDTWDQCEIRVFDTDPLLQFITSCSFHATTKRFNTDVIYSRNSNDISKAEKKVAKAEKRQQKALPDIKFIIEETVSEQTLNEIELLHNTHQNKKIRKGMDRKRLFHNNVHADFNKELIRLWQKLGWLVCYRLVLHNKTVSFMIVRKTKTEAFAYLMAFSDVVRKFEPARFMFVKCYEHMSTAYGINWVRLGWGVNPAKSDCTNLESKVYDVILTNRTLRARALSLISDIVKRLITIRDRLRRYV